MDLHWLRPVALQVFRSINSNAGLSVDELVQVGALAAVECVPDYDASRGATLKSWQWKKAEWAMQELVKRSARRHRLAPMHLAGLIVLGSDQADWETPAQIPDPAPGPEQLCLMAQCRRAVNLLPGHQRQLLTMRFAHDLTRSDVARETGGDRWTVRAAEKAALTALRSRIIKARSTAGD